MNLNSMFTRQIPCELLARQLYSTIESPILARVTLADAEIGFAPC